MIQIWKVFGSVISVEGEQLAAPEDVLFLFRSQTSGNYSILGGRQMLNATSHPPIANMFTSLLRDPPDAKSW
jgi:hypothetical protein